MEKGVQQNIAELREIVVSLAKEVYQKLGGFGWYSENELKEALSYEFIENNLPYLQELAIPVIYKGHQIKKGYIDFVVFDRNAECGILVEIKTADNMSGDSIHQAVEYYRAIKSGNSPVPGFLKEKIQGILVLNWGQNKKELFNDYASNLPNGFIPETLPEDYDYLDQERDILEVVEINLHSKREKYKKKSKR